MCCHLFVMFITAVDCKTHLALSISIMYLAFDQFIHFIGPKEEINNFESSAPSQSNLNYPFAPWRVVIDHNCIDFF